MPADGDLPGSDGLKFLSDGVGFIDDAVSLFRGKKQTVTNNNRKTLNTVTKETEEVSAEKAMALMQQILGGTQGLGQLAQGEKGAGLYNSTVNKQLTNDLLARTVAQVASLSSIKTSAQTGNIDENTTNTTKKKGALEWVICTELHKQGRMCKKYYDTGWPVFARTPVRVKAGYYFWAIPAVHHLRAHPNSIRSHMLEAVMNARAEYIAAQVHVTGAKKTIFGYIALKGLYAICWTLSRTVARKPVDFMSLYTK
jgi:hypothetical protein